MVSRFAAAVILAASVLATSAHAEAERDRKKETEYFNRTIAEAEAKQDAEREENTRLRNEAIAKSKADMEKYVAEQARREEEKERQRLAEIAQKQADDAERERVRKEEEDAAVAAKAEEIKLLNKLAKDPKWVRRAFSARLCRALASEAEAKSGIREEHSKARLGGVLNMSAVSDWQEQAHDAIKKAQSYRRDLEKLRIAPLSCRERLMAEAAECTKGDAINGWDCPDEPDLNSLVLILAEIVRGDAEREAEL
jgi:hypothetical protein